MADALEGNAYHQIVAARENADATAPPFPDLVLSLASFWMWESSTSEE